MTDLEYLKKYGNPEDFEKNVLQLKKGIPVQYIVGNVSFYGINLKVTKDVLIPRFETEELVEKVLYYQSKYQLGKKCIDLGTGSGCIAITLATRGNNVTAVDISKKALEVAKTNAEDNNVDIQFIESDFWKNVEGTYDVIVSNPPYIAEDEEIMEIVKNNEPSSALFAKDEGMACYQTILKDALKYCQERTLIAFEIGASQREKIISLARQYFPKEKMWVEKDLQQRDRFFFLLIERTYLN